MVSLLQIVPRLPPPEEGVGSYALCLERALAGHGISTRFLTAEGGLIPSLEESEEEALLLHYANYGYQRRGCPFWMPGALRRWRRRGGRRLVTVFHEVYATGPPWRSSFWTQPFQQRIAAAVARASDALVTSLDLYVHRIGPAAAPGKTSVTPVFSTVGEPPEVPPLSARARRMVLFGGRGARGRAYGEARRDLVEACRSLGVEEIADVGPPLEGTEETVDGIPIRRLGVLPAAEVGRLLLGSLAGFVAYPAYFLPKSSIFAAYCAHGVLPVQAWRRRSPAGGPAPVWSGGDPQETAAAARAWYRGHSLERQAERFRELLAA
ncbi:MAG TPA: glycosyltransferase family 1 protein [Thermoanaerobaculia bacterium]